MSQRNVERVIGRLATDEAFRRRFAGDRQSALAELIADGVELTRCEQMALGALDTLAVGRFADAIDPRLQKCELHGFFARRAAERRLRGDGSKES
jgi:hypothetical protein